MGVRATGLPPDIQRIADGLLVEHWDVLQDEATWAESLSGLPMFGRDFAA
jgi:predicted SnoaL-like aldol condensation-catalyzing enzyme